MDLDDTSDQQRPFDSMQMRWSEQHPYPHSHHGTPAAEYPGFAWGSPPLPLHSTTFSPSPPQRPSHQSLQPLMMPTWPSMLSSQPAFYPTILPQAQVGTTSPPIATPVSAASSTRSGPSVRKTLSDDDRRRMCKYAEENPTAKQTEIGYLFGVERSTVSKVLRKKDIYLNQSQPKECPRSPPTKRSKSRIPDIEKTLSAWVVKEQKKGSPITDEAIREQACYFASIPGPENPALNPINTSGWLEKFKQKHHIASSNKGKLRKDSVADPESAGSNAASSRQSPTGISPDSLDNATISSPSPPLNDNIFLKMEDTEDFKPPKRRKSPPSISTVFTELGSSSACFTPNILSPTSPFFTPDSTSTAGAPQRFGSPDRNPGHFPALDNFISSPNSSSSTTMSPKYLSSLSSPDEPNALDSIDEAMETEPTIDPIATLLPAAPIEARRLAAAALGRRGLEDGKKPTQDDAREALRVVLKFFEGQPSGVLDLQEGVLLGRLVEKLQLKREG